MQTKLSTRQHELDWLRVIAFGLLIPFHIGMFFNDSKWHIKNSVVWESIDIPMIFVSQWRMSLLFFISGATLVFLVHKRNPRTFLAERARRLLLPLLFGMLVIVPPQTYLQFKAQAGLASFWQVYPFMMADGFSEFNWNHLWYLVYLFVYTAVLLPLLRQSPNRLTRLLTHPLVLGGLGLAGGLTEYWLRPLFRSTHDLTDDWANHALYLPIFLMGYSVYAHIRARDFIVRYRRHFLGVGLVTATCLYRYYWLDSIIPTGPERFVYQLLKGTNRWMWILTLVGFSIHYLSFGNRFLRYATDAVLPFYILHQTVIIILAYPLISLDWASPVKFLYLFVATWLICLAIYEGVIRRTSWLSPLLGLKATIISPPESVGQSRQI